MAHLKLAQAVEIINGGANSICPEEVPPIRISLPALTLQKRIEIQLWSDIPFMTG